MINIIYKTVIKFLLLAIAISPSFLFAKEEDFISSFVVGKYLLIGKAVDSDTTYTGKVEIYKKDSLLKVNRTIKGQTIVGSAAIESALNGETKALRIRFNDNGIKYEETCLWSSDLDNYARISCYLYQPGERTINPGLEALFYDHSTK